MLDSGFGVFLLGMVFAWFAMTSLFERFVCTLPVECVERQALQARRMVKKQGTAHKQVSRLRTGVSQSAFNFVIS